MAIKPVGHRILVKPEDVNKRLEYDFGEAGKFKIQTDEKLERSMEIYGVLVAAGDQAWKAFGPNHSGEPWAKPGDKILFSRHAGKYVQDPETEEEFLLMNDEDITAVITGGE